MVISGAHLNERQSARHERRLHPANPGPITQLAEAILAPAIGGAARTNAAGVQSSGADLGEAHAPSHSRGDEPHIGRAVAELALAIRAQQYAASLVVTPHVWLVPALTCAKAKRPGTGVEVRRLVKVPSPTCPSPLVPQQ